MSMFPIKGIKALPLEMVRTMPHLKTSGVYCIVSPTHKKYFGKSKNIYKRILQYLNGHSKGQRRLYHSFNCHGIDKHYFCVVEFCKIEELNAIESYYIKFYGTHKGELNLTTGGEGYEISEETREIKRRQLLEKNPMKGKTHTPEVKELLRQITMGNIEKIRESSRITSTGRVFSKESREKKSKSLMGHPVSDEVKNRLRLLRSKPVDQYDMQGAIVASFSSAKEARLKTGIQNVSICAAGKYKQAGGFIWKYKYNIQ